MRACACVCVCVCVCVCLNVVYICGWWCRKRQLQKPWYRANDTDENNAAARRAYESLMTITLRKPDSPEYLNFSRQVIKRARHHSRADAYDDDEGVTGCLRCLELCFVIAKFHYTDTDTDRAGPARTFLRRNSVGSGRARVVEFSYKQVCVVEPGLVQG